MKVGDIMTAKELSKKTGLSISRVYQMARKLGRLPTIQELEERKGIHPGRPALYFNNGATTAQSGTEIKH